MRTTVLGPSKMRALALLVLTVGASTQALAADRSRNEKPDAVVQANVLRMQGACTAIGCPDIVYEVAVFEIFDQSGVPDLTDAELALPVICAPSGLTLGSMHRFQLFKSDLTYKEFSKAPRRYDSEEATCDYAARVVKD